MNENKTRLSKSKRKIKPQKKAKFTALLKKCGCVTIVPKLTMSNTTTMLHVREGDHISGFADVNTPSDGMHVDIRLGDCSIVLFFDQARAYEVAEKMETLADEIRETYEREATRD